MKREKEIIMIFTNKEPYRIASQVVEENEYEYPVYFTALENAINFAQEKIQNGAEIIISRGGVASYIQNKLSVPVISVRYSFSDFANSLEKACKYSKKVAFVSFGEGFLYAQRIRSFLSADVMLVQVNTLQEIPKALDELKRSGIEAIISGYSVMSIAEKYNFHCVPMQSNPYNILEAIEDAEHILSSLHEKQVKVQTISAVLDCCTTAVIALAPDGSITNINALARHLLQAEQLTAVGRCYSELLGSLPSVDAALSGTPSYRNLITYHNEMLAVSCVPIQIKGKNSGAVINLQGSSEIQTLESKIRIRTAANGYFAKFHFDDIVGCSRVLMAAKQKAMTYAIVDSTVMIYGESGTGKELFAQSIHNSSSRKKNPFVAINCAALSESLLESELFGYVKGAFTGARNEGKPGIFELAHNGTIFLDEIGEMTPNLQARLLRVLQEKEVMRLGDDKVIPVNVRILAATNRNLQNEVEKGNFRADLYYRLCVLVLHLPALRERQDDIQLLSQHFVRAYSLQYSRNIEEISQKAIAFLKTIPFYGNIREFSNLIERAVVLCEGPIIGVNEIMRAQEEDFTNTHHTKSDGNAEKLYSSQPPESVQQALRAREIDLIRHTLLRHGGNRTETAKELGISRATLWRKIKEYGI